MWGPRMAVLVGIDEAGFGPILGPLVVSSCTFSVPEKHIKTNLWRLLSKSVAKTRKHLAGRLLVVDSKKAYSKSAGIQHLERTVISCLKCFGQNPADLAHLLRILCPNSIERLANYPWHNSETTYKIKANPADVEIAAKTFKRDLDESNMELLNMKSCCLDVGHYNKLVDAVRNKANVLFTATSQLIKSAYDNYGEQGLQVIVDRQGGRVHYQNCLQTMFPGLELTILKETQKHSSYELKAGQKQMRVHFIVGADQNFLPVSLASMVSKYLRQLLVGNINRYFISFAPELKPTAGYWKDGLRFIQEIKTNLPSLKYDKTQLIRCR